MFLKMVKNDFLRNKIVTMSVFVFITMAVILAASAINNIANLIQSMSELQERAVPADITQMHSGEFDQAEIDQFTEEQRENIAMQETMVLLTFDGSNIHFGKIKRWLELYRIFHLLYRIRNLILYWIWIMKSWM